MIKIIFYVVALAALVVISVWFAETPGTVSIDWHGWRVDTSVAMLFVIILGALALGTFLVRVWGTVVGAGRAFQSARKDKRLNRGLDALARGFAAVHGSDFAAAGKASREARSALGDVTAVRLLDQQTALVGDNRSEASAAARTLLDEPALESAMLRDLATIAMKTGDREGALGHALRALGQKPPPRWAGAMALDLQIALALWQDAAATAERKDIQAILGGENAPAAKAALFGRAAHAALRKTETSAAIKWARKALSADPKQTDASTALALALIAEGKAKKAAAELEKAWTVTPSPALLTAYLQIAPGEAPLARAGRLEKLVTGNPDHPESRLALADAALAAELWGQARSRLEPLLDAGTTASIRSRAATLMAQVELGDTGDTEQATQTLVMALDACDQQTDPPAPESLADLLARSD